MALNLNDNQISIWRRGRGWMPVAIYAFRLLAGVNFVVLTKTGLDAKSGAAVKIATTENNGQRFYPLFIFFTVTTATTVTIAPIYSLGTNSAAYTNIIAAITLTGLNAEGLFLPTWLAAAVASVAPNTDIFAKANTLATAAALTVDCAIGGVYL